MAFSKRLQSRNQAPLSKTSYKDEKEPELQDTELASYGGKQIVHFDLMIAYVCIC